MQKTNHMRSLLHGTLFAITFCCVLPLSGCERRKSGPEAERVVAPPAGSQQTTQMAAQPSAQTALTVCFAKTPSCLCFQQLHQAARRS
jgi:hypothetical protein